MTLEDWLGSFSSAELHGHSARKLHLLTAALLRRVWDDLPSEHTRIAVAATERFADGHLSGDDLARLRSTDFLESCDPLWLGPDDSSHDEQLIGMGCWDCPCCDRAASEYECRAAHKGYVLDGVRSGVDDPGWQVARAALHSREVVMWKAAPEERNAAEREEAEAQYQLFQELIGPECTDPDWPRWRTFDVLALARGIHRDQAFDRLPILADALQDAGCDDEAVLDHCRRPGGHVRGCWVVDLAMGVV